MKKYIAALSLSILALAACGGSGNDTPPLSRYAGDYASCDGDHVRQFIGISQPVGNILTIKLHERVYQYAECSGAVVGYFNYSSPVTFSYSQTKDAVVYGYPTWNKWNTAAIDAGTSSISTSTVSVTGSGAKMIDGKACAVVGSKTFCRESTIPANTDSAGIILFNGILYSATLKFGTGGPYYNVDSIDVKQ